MVPASALLPHQLLSHFGRWVKEAKALTLYIVHSRKNSPNQARKMKNDQSSVFPYSHKDKTINSFFIDIIVIKLQP